METDDTQAEARPGSDAVAQAVASAGAAVFQRHTPNASAGPSAAGSAGQALPSAGQALPGAAQALDGKAVLDPVVAEANREMVRKGVVALMLTIDDHIGKRIYTSALAVSEDKEFAAGFAAEVALGDNQANRIGDLSAIVAEKWGISAKYAPEFALCFALGTYATTVHFAVRKLDNMARAKQAERLAKEKSATSTN